AAHSDVQSRRTFAEPFKLRGAGFVRSAAATRVRRRNYLGACLNIRFGRCIGPGWSAPVPDAAKLAGRWAWTFRVRQECSPCCARGRAHSVTGLFKQALSDRKIFRNSDVASLHTKV